MRITSGGCLILQKLIDAAMECARKWRLSANIKKYAVMVCNDSRVDKVDFKCKWGVEELPRVDKSTYLRVEFRRTVRRMHTHKESKRKREDSGRTIAPDMSRLES